MTEIIRLEKNWVLPYNIERSFVPRVCFRFENLEEEIPMAFPQPFRGKIYDDITQCISHTPLVRLRRVVGKSKANVAAKLELLHPIWSAKGHICLAKIHPVGLEVKR